MRTSKITLITFATISGLLASTAVFAQTTPTTPPGIDPLTGARPGNVIGTGDSLPKSNNASNINTTDTKSLVAPTLPVPPLSDASSPRDFLVAARAALAANRTGEAQEALERAESRSLAGNVLASQADQPSRQKMVQMIASARQSLAAGDKAGCIQTIDTALQGG